MEEKECNAFHLEGEGRIIGNKTFKDLAEEWKMNDVERFEYVMEFMRANYAEECDSINTSKDLMEKIHKGMEILEEHAKVYNEKRKVCEKINTIHFNLLANIANNAMCLVVEMDDAEDRLRAFCELTEVMADTFKRKNHDYGNSFDKSLDKFGLVAAACRMGDKMNRIVSLTKDEALVKDESVRDTLLDLANYAVMTVMWVDKIVGNTFA